MLITILTPTYNRKDFLSNCYKSLLKQSNKDFEWLIVDDGSTDKTSALISKFIEEGKIKIRYFEKKNGGKHTALNAGFKLAEGKLTVILDSDDILTENAIERIEFYYKKYKNCNLIACFSFLKANMDGKVIGDHYPEKEVVSDYINMRVKKGIKGDKCEVFITNILKKFTFYENEFEKYLGESYMWIKIGRFYDTVYINEILYLAEYLDDGLTKLGRVTNIKSPNGAIEHSKEFLESNISIKQNLKYSLLYVSYSLFANKSIKEIIVNSNMKIYVLINLTNGFLLYSYWNRKYK